MKLPSVICFSSKVLSAIPVDLKERMNNNVYFLICDKGILLKAVSPEILRQSEDEVNKFFNTAKIE